MPRALGFDVGGTNLRAAVVDGSGRILIRRAERIGRDPEAVIARLLSLGAALMEPGLAGIGIGVPGRVDAGARAMLSGGFIDFTGCRLPERVEEVLGLPVTIENDATMALIGETRAGAARGMAEAVLLTIGTGIGGAVLSRGAILRGMRAAGQLGHVTVAPDGPPCLCGRTGCLETLSSGTALGRLVAAAGFPPGTTAETLLATESPPAAALLAAWAGPLRAAAETLVAAYDPEVILLGGGLGGAAAAAVARLPPNPGWFRPILRQAALGDDAGVIGAAVAAGAA